MTGFENVCLLSIEHVSRDYDALAMKQVWKRWAGSSRNRDHALEGRIGQLDQMIYRRR